MQAEILGNRCRKKIKILYVMDYFYSPFGGTEGQLYNLISRLNRIRFDPELLLYRKFAFEPDMFEKNPFPCKVSFLDFHSFYSLEGITRLFRLRRYIKEQRFDIVQLLFNDSAITVPIICAGLRVKVITTRRDMGYWYTPANLAALRINAMFVDRYLVNSYAVKENVKRKEHVSDEKIAVIYNGHNLSRFGIAKREDFYQEMLIPNGAVIVGMVANYRPVKRVEDLILAFSGVLNMIPHSYLVIVGDMYDSHKKCTELAKVLGVEKHVRFLGKTREVIPLVKHFTVGVNCSESEGLSNVIIEFMGCGVPVVCSETSGNKELVEENRTGLLYPVGDIRALASCIVRIIRDKDLRNCLIKNGKQLVELRFVESKIAQEYERLYIDVVSHAERKNGCSCFR